MSLGRGPGDSESVEGREVRNLGWQLREAKLATLYFEQCVMRARTGGRRGSRIQVWGVRWDVGLGALLQVARLGSSQVLDPFHGSTNFALLASGVWSSSLAVKTLCPSSKIPKLTSCKHRVFVS